MQVPSNHNHISHQIYRETASEEPFKSILNGFQRYAPVLSIDEYAQLLFDCGAENIVVFEKIYAHVLEDSDAVVEWISGTALVPYFERLGEHKEEFVEAIRNKDACRAAGSACLLSIPQNLVFSKKTKT